LPDQKSHLSPAVATQPAKSWVPTQDFVAGIVLLALGGFAIFESANLTAGTLSAFGPGLLPRTLAIGVVLMGALILLLDLFDPGERIEALSWRGPVFISASLFVFALTIKPLGLLGAIPLTIAFAGGASPETRWREIAVLAAGMTVACIVVFGYLLTLSIPVGPSWWPTHAFTTLWK
jgi:putative tricarboxylic transport membrane protein